MGTIEKVFVFLNTPKKQREFSKHVRELNQIQTRKVKLQQLCSTRWIKRNNSVAVFEQLLPAVHSCLEEMTGWSNSKTSIKAPMLLLSL
jgi:hypothetical protein